MTTHEIGQRAPSRHARRKRRRNYGHSEIARLVCAAIFAAGYCVGVSAADKAVPHPPGAGPGEHRHPGALSRAQRGPHAQPHPGGGALAG